VKERHKALSGMKNEPQFAVSQEHTVALWNKKLFLS
jgi:hypothetical protein